MPIVSKLADYTDKDFDSLKLRLRNLVRSVFPEWTDFNVANFGNILLELFAHTGDVLTFYQDNQGRQSRITSATQRKALLGLVKLIGYAPSTASAATADVAITLDAVPGGDVTFPAGTIVQTEEVTSPIRYQLLHDVTIPAGTNPPVATGSAENSATQSENFLSSGLPNQTIALSFTPYIDGTIVLIAGNGSYVQVENFLDSAPSDRHFVLQVDQNDRASLRFGNGVNGAIPIGTMALGYRTGGGSAGRVEMSKLRVFEQTSWSDSFGANVRPSVTNASASSGGTDRQSIAQIKERAPASLRVLNRTVAREDYEINALRLPAVARALMLTSNQDPSIEENTGQLYIIPVGGGAPSDALKAQVLNQVTVVFPNTLTFDVGVFDPLYRDVNVRVVAFFRSGANRPLTAAAIRSNLATFFMLQNTDGTENPNIDFGAKIVDADGVVVSELAFSDIENVVRDTTGVRKLSPVASDFTLNDAHDDITLGVKEFPRLGTVVIIDGDTGEPL